jgi:hypothetical protein
MALSAPLFAADLPLNELTGNNIYGLAGNGDTVWLLTDQGINYTIATSDTLTWRGLRARLPGIALAFGAQTAVLCLDTTAYQKPNNLWLYSHVSHLCDSLAMPFDRSKISDATLGDSAVLMAMGVAYGAGYFWLACGDAGLARFDPLTRGLRFFFPGIRSSFGSGVITLDSATFGIRNYSDLVRKRIIGVSVQEISTDTTAVLALTGSTLYRFFPRDTTWDTLSSRLNGSLTLDQYGTVFGNDRSPDVYASISPNGGQGAQLFRYDKSAATWTLLSSTTNVTSLTFGPKAVVYMIDNNFIKRFTNGADDGIYQDFVDRITLASGAQNPDRINDILYLPETDSTGSFWIATSGDKHPTWNGLFFSRFEERDEKSKTPFAYVRLERKISSGLKETYAGPGIISSGISQAVFAYSLSKASDVTISVFDWNMNLVKNVIVNRSRVAGANDPLGNGRSTNRKEDVWDGTNATGKRVAVGVYYFKITAKSGERSFGKIIVAK